MKDKVAEWAEELQSLAQVGLFYGKDEFDRERYQRIREIAAEMMAHRTGMPLELVKGLFCNETGYQTPKVDTRAAVFQDGKLLLVQERGGALVLTRWLVRVQPVPGGEHGERSKRRGRGRRSGQTADRRTGPEQA
jgi:hypothetical protein